MNAPTAVARTLPAGGAGRDVPVRQVSPAELPDTLARLKRGEDGVCYEMLFDLSAVDDAGRGGGFTVFYHLVSLSANRDLRIEVHLPDDSQAIASATPLWPSANWYEREVYDLFGLRFEGHPDLRRILLPVYWEGHPLRKSYPGRATEHGPYSLPPERYRELMAPYQIADTRGPGAHEDEYVLNIGPNHPGTHGILRLIARMRGETIASLDPDIGFHHRGAEKIAERHTFHNYIPYCDRIDYLAGVANELPYVMAVEQLAGIDVPERAVVMRVLLSELFRINAHLVWLGSYGHDLGVMGPAFYCFSVREKLFDVMELITGGRMHPAFFRIGGVALDMPEGWRAALDTALDAIDGSMGEFAALTVDNPIFQARTLGNGQYTRDQAIEWGFTGPNLRCTGLAWDLRKTRPYCGYEDYDFEVPTATQGDALARTRLRIEEIRQSLRIVRQAADRLPGGPVLSDRARFSFARKAQTLEDIETLIHHFIGTGRGMGFPVGDAFFCAEAPKGMMGFYVVSDGSSQPYRVRIRTPSFPHVQAFSWLATGGQLGDLIPMIGSMDYVLADLDR
ncbi:NADH dehydrogenase (quinone) subunit D [Acidihalobacter ferrooxydans]|uniref:Multifunctional fusion protein n=1 Tax=Acidihalobacter ferrooxydans TaxID=1765967 RepID=A0A1P8UKI8_9GAMM|nr:NADH dehydrogenase (quinone) subunit D [Acidihalobacter ferrooxydans]APZ44282.1 NADH dehydrogenase [Acidihalobacter ferrooxydans]